MIFNANKILKWKEYKKLEDILEGKSFTFTLISFMMYPVSPINNTVEVKLKLELKEEEK